MSIKKKKMLTSALVGANIFLMPTIKIKKKKKSVILLFFQLFAIAPKRCLILYS